MCSRLCMRLVCIRADVLVHTSVLRDFSGTHSNLCTVKSMLIAVKSAIKNSYIFGFQKLSQTPEFLKISISKRKQEVNIYDIHFVRVEF